MQFKFKPHVTVDAPSFFQARNKLLRVLAKAEQDGEIQHFDISFEEGF